MAKTLAKKTTSKSSKQEVASELDEVLLSLRDKRDQQKDLKEDIEGLQTRGLELFEKLGVSSHSFKGPDGKTIRASRQQSSSQVIDEVRLKKKVGLSVWNKITSRVLDRKKLEASLSAGEIKPAVVADCYTEKPNAPYIKVK